MIVKKQFPNFYVIISISGFLFNNYVVWFAYRRCFKAGHNEFHKYWKKMNLKFKKTIGRLKKTARQNTWLIVFMQ